MTKLILSIERTALLATFLVTPLLVTPVTTELFEFPKTVWLYLCAIIIGSCCLLRKIDDTNRRRQFPWRNYLPFLPFGISFIISTIFSIHINTSLFGYYTRFFGGLISYLALATVLISLGDNLKNDHTFYPKVILAIKTSALLAAGWGILEHFGIDRHYWVQNVQSRVFSTLGQPNWLAAFLTLTIFPTLSGALHVPGGSLKDKPLTPIPAVNSSPSGSKGWGCVLSFVISYTALWFTGSVSGFLGFLSGAGMWLLLIPKGILRQNWQRLFLITAACLTISTTRPGLLGQRIKRYLTLSLLPPAMAQSQADSPLSQPGGDTWTIRKIVWRGTLNLIAASPRNFLIGTGPATFPYAFLPYRPAELNRTSEWDFLYNKAHNEILNIAAEQGLLGLGSFLFLVFSVIKQGVRGAKNAKNPAIAGLISGWAGLLITNLVGFFVVPTALLFWAYPILQKYLIKRQQQ